MIPNTISATKMANVSMATCIGSGMMCTPRSTARDGDIQASRNSRVNPINNQFELRSDVRLNCINKRLRKELTGIDLHSG